jgi:hypothetical protein
MKHAIAILVLAVAFTGTWVAISARSAQVADERADSEELRASVQAMTHVCLRQRTASLTP